MLPSRVAPPMHGFPRIALTLLLLALSAPSATAAPLCEPAGAVCVTDESSSDGECANGGFQAGTTSVDAGLQGTATASAGGSWYCAGTQHYHSIGGGAATPAGAVAVAWTEYGYSDPENGEFSDCFVATPLLFQPCPVSPPNPGWGSLLP